MLVWQGSKFAVFFFISLSGYRYLGVKFCMMVHIGPGQVFSSFGGGTSRGSSKSEIFGINFGPFTANISKTV